MLKRIAIGVAGLSLLTVAVLLPPAPGAITPADAAGACIPIQTDSGPVYPAGSTVYDRTDPVDHWLTGKPMCPRGFGSMHLLIVREADEKGPPPKAWHCVRNVQELNCPKSSEATAEPSSV